MKPASTPDDVVREMNVVRSVAGLRETDDVTFDDEGWDSRVYVVNRGAAIFKFPRHAAARDAYPAAIAALELLAGGDGTVRVPTVQWVGPDCSYFGCVGIVGRQLGRVHHELGDADRTRIGTDLGHFLAWLHRLHLPDARVVTVDDEIAQFVERSIAAWPTIERELSNAEAAALSEFVHHELPDTLRMLDRDPRLCHGDLGSYNLILGDDGMIGVIDFGDIGMFDRSKDFIGFEYPAMLEAALRAYGDAPNLRAKVDIRARALPLLDLPFLIAHDDDRAVGRLLERLRRSVTTDG